MREVGVGGSRSGVLDLSLALIGRGHRKERRGKG